MNENFEKLKEIYGNVHKLTLEVTSLFAEDNFNSGNEVLEERGKLLKKADKLRMGCNFSEDEKKVLNLILQDLKSIDEENINKLTNNRGLAQVELNKVNKNQKLIAAYKFNKEELEPRLFDSME